MEAFDIKLFNKNFKIQDVLNSIDEYGFVRILDFVSSEKLKELNVKRPKPVAGAESNYSYYPIIFETEELLKEQAHVLAQNLVNTRRYFYPSLTGLPYVKKQKTPVSNSISRRVLCLPLYYDLAKEEIDMITRLLLRTQNNR